jgi:hypothetical protein
MIEWVSLAKLDAALRDCGPNGLQLRAFFHADTARDPASLIEQAPEELIEEGLGPVSAWGGWDDDVPFLIRAAPLLLAGGYGLEVDFPVCTLGGAVLLERLAHRPLPPLTSVYFESLAAGPFGVRDVAADCVIYRSASREDAAAVARFVVARLGAAYEVIEVAPIAARFAVVGPACGPFFSRVEPARDRADAERLADACTNRYGVPFRTVEL